MPPSMFDRIPDSVIAGTALLGLTGVVACVTLASASWLSLAALALGIGVAAFVLGRLGLVRGSGGPARAARETWPPWWLVIPAAAATALTAASASGSDRAGDAHVARLWLTSIALLLLAAWWRPLGRRPWRRPSWRAALPWIGMIAIAALPRLVMLDRFPTVLTGDEGSFMVNARMAKLGELPGVFETGFLGNPNLYPAISGYVSVLGGSSPSSYRLFSAIVGALGVLATWRLGRHLLGAWEGAAGAVILATMPLNLHFSRNALNNISDATALAAALLFLVRATSGGRRLDAALGGVALGLGAYGYFGGRAFPGVVLASLATLALGRRLRPGETLRIAGWTVAGFIVTAMPLIMAFRDNPAELGGRLNQVSPLGRAALADDPAGTIARYLVNLRDAVLVPLIGTGEPGPWFFHRDPPLLGWPVAILLPIGAAVCAIRIARDRDARVVAFIAVPAALLTGGVALTVPIAAQRMLALTPLWALVAGAGLVLLARWVATIGPAPVARVALAVALVAMAVTDLRWAASEDRQIETYGDARTIAMWDIGWRVDHAPDAAAPSPEVLFAGPPYVFAGGFNSLVIQAPDLAMRDVFEPLGTAPAPPLPAGSMLVIMSERQSERCEAERLYPDATVAEARDRKGELLYIALYPEPLRGWSTARTPAQTTFVVADASPCG